MKRLLVLVFLAASICRAQTTSVGTVTSQGTVVTPPTGTFDGPAELPRLTECGGTCLIDTTMPNTSGYAAATVTTAAQLQTAINTAAAATSTQGTVITVTAGSTLTTTSGITLTKPAVCSKSTWIIIKNSGTVPAAGTRLLPTAAQLAQMATINSDATASNVINVDTSSLGACYYRLIGLEIAPVSTNTNLDTAILLSSNTEATAADFTSHIIIDHCYVHGLDYPYDHSKRGISPGGTYIAIIDSYVSNWWFDINDNQAIGSWEGPGPFLFDDNFVEAATENIFFGGPPSTVPNIVPSDAQVTHNYIRKRLRWNNNGYKSIGQASAQKNLIECKSCQRLLIEGNVVENSWIAGQNGAWLTLTPRCSQTGNCTGSGSIPQAVVSDITARNNYLLNIGQIFQLSGADNCDFPGPCDAGTGTTGDYRLRGLRESIHDNVILSVSSRGWVQGGVGESINIYGSVTPNPQSTSIKHNTIRDDYLPMSANFPGSGPNLNQTATGYIHNDNLFSSSTNGWSPGPSTFLAQIDPSGVFTGNVVENLGASGVSSGNFNAGNQTCGGSTTCFPAQLSSLGMVNAVKCFGYDDSLSNDTVTGTTNGLLVTTSAGKAITAGTGTADSTILGVCNSSASCTTSGTPIIVEAGQAICTFDGATTRGDGITHSTTSAGQCHDTGAAFVNGNLGIVQTPNASSGAYGVYMAAVPSNFDPANCALTGGSAYHNAAPDDSKDIGATTITTWLPTWAGEVHLWKVETIAPTSGTHLGGTSVLITASHLNNINGAFPSVTVGGVACTGVIWLDDETLACTTGAHATGAVDIVVTDNSESATLTGGYTYN